MTELYLGVDAGNSKTVAVVADGHGTVLGTGRSGNGDIYGAGEAAAVVAVTAAVGAALDAAGMDDADRRDRRDGSAASAGSALQSAAFCLAGVDWDDDHAFWHAELARMLPGLGRRYTLLNDGFALLRAGAPDGLGVALSAGTGAAVVARGPRRGDRTPEWTASFWIVGMVGGADLGWAALQAVVSAELGLGPATALTGRVLDRWGYPDVPTLLELTTRRHGDQPRRAALARDVLLAAEDGDDVARVIVADQAHRLAGYATAAAGRVELDGAFPVVLGGSVLSSDHAALREATIAAVGQVLPDCSLVAAHRSPVLGALIEAYARVGALDPEVLDALDRHVFPEDFLLT